MPRPQLPERRERQRRWCFLAADCQRDGQPVEEVAVTDLTPEGLCVALLRPAPPGTLLQLTPRPVGSGPELRARVEWVVTEGRYHWAGCTLERPLTEAELRGLLAAQLLPEPPGAAGAPG